MDNLETLKKSKISVYMSEKDEMLLTEIFIKRMKDKNKTDKSAIMCEAIRLLYEKEIGSSDNQK